MNWEPISTAPKDGTIIWLKGGADDCLNYVGEKDKEFCQAPCRAKWTQHGWMMAIAEGGYVSVMRDNPTHWSPMVAQG